MFLRACILFYSRPTNQPSLWLMLLFTSEPFLSDISINLLSMLLTLPSTTKNTQEKLPYKDITTTLNKYKILPLIAVTNCIFEFYPNFPYILTFSICSFLGRRRRKCICRYVGVFFFVNWVKLDKNLPSHSMFRPCYTAASILVFKKKKKYKIYEDG